jgi:hypothetical protein
VLTVWGNAVKLALSSWKTAFGQICCKNGNTKGLKNSSIYRCEFKLPLTMYSWVLRLTLIPAQTITDPPPKRSCSVKRVSPLEVDIQPTNPMSSATFLPCQTIFQLTGFQTYPEKWIVTFKRK